MSDCGSEDCVWRDCRTPADDPEMRNGTSHFGDLSTLTGTGRSCRIRCAGCGVLMGVAANCASWHVDRIVLQEEP